MYNSDKSKEREMNFLYDKFFELAHAPVHIYNKNYEEIQKLIPKKCADPLGDKPQLVKEILEKVYSENVTVKPTPLLPYCAMKLSDGNFLVSGPFKTNPEQLNAASICDLYAYFFRRINPEDRDTADDSFIKETLSSCMDDFDLKEFEKILPTEAPHNTYAHELAHLEAITKGDPELALRCKLMPVHGKLGTLGPNLKRHIRNHCIVGTTLAARAAIKGGISVETAFTVADYFINKVELINDEKLLKDYTLKIVVVFATLVRNLHERGKKSLRPTVSRIVEEIKRSLYKPVTKEDLVAVCDMHKDYAERIFKQDTGVTIMEYLTESRIQIACELLKDSQTSISEISSILCFSSQSYFGRVFKKVTGKTPAQYRNQSFVKVWNQLD